MCQLRVYPTEKYLTDGQVIIRIVSLTIVQVSQRIVPYYILIVLFLILETLKMCPDTINIYNSTCTLLRCHNVSFRFCI